MNLVGYLVTLANLQSFHHSGGPLKDLSIKVAEIQSFLRDFQRDPAFNLENYRQTGYYREGYIGKYLSKNLRDYLYDGIGNPTDEGVVLTLIYNDAEAAAPKIINDPDRSLSYFLHRQKVEPDVKEGINAYLGNFNTKRTK